MDNFQKNVLKWDSDVISTKVADQSPGKNNITNIKLREFVIYNKEP